MLSPEVQNFKEPACIVQSKKVERDTCLRILNDFNFVHSVTVFLPDILKTPNSFGTGLSNCDYYKISSLNIGEVVNETFLQNFIHHGSLNLLSINTRIDCDDCVAVTSSGKLILHLNKITYQTLGLEGKLSHFHSKTKEKYIVTIDLKSDNLKNSKPYYKRIKSCLQKLKKFEIIATWDSPKTEICPSSMAKYFFNLGYSVKLSRMKYNTQIKYSIDIPIIMNVDEFDGDDCANFVEWLGMVSLDCNLNETQSYISTYVTPEPCTRIGQLRILQWKGFLNSKMVAEFLTELDSKYGSTEFWKAVYFQGFSDSPVVWGSNEHHYFTNGDNGGVIIMNKNKYHMYLQKCSNKRYK